MRRLEDLEIYQISMKISDIIWDEVIKWDNFPKSTIGKQLVECADSISANIAEGYGRNSNKETKQFCYYSRGSMKETGCFLQKSRNRNLIKPEVFEVLSKDLELLGKKLNGYINYLK